MVVAVGLATGKGQLLQLKLDAGDHEKVPAPLPFKVVLLPSQMVASAPAEAPGVEGVKIVIVSLAVPQLLVTVRV